MNTICIIMLAVFTAIAGYGIGLRRGCKSYEHDYDEGYLQGYNDAAKELTRESNARELINQLDELFGEEDEEYAS